MAEIKMPTSELKLLGNSQTHQTNSTVSEERPRVKKVAQGIVKKKGFGRRFADIFFGEEVVDVKGYILQDVLIPAIKDTISDVVTGGIDMLLFGERGNRSTRNSRSSRTSYSSYYGNSRRVSSNSETSSRTSHSRYYSVKDVLLESRGEAEEVLGNMIDAIKDYGMVSVADLYDMVGIPGAFTDNAWGWFDLGNASVRRVREGYLLVLPKVESLK